MTLKSHFQRCAVKGLAVVFTGLAAGCQFLPMPVSAPVQSNDLTRFIHQQIGNGIRGIGVGESHDSVAMPEEILRSLSAFKKDGGSTIYVEWLPNENQNLLDRVARGDQAAMRSLREIFEYTWGASHETAQIRYDFIRQAQDMGLRVIGIDVPVGDTYRFQSFSPKSSADRDRLIVADPYMTDIIRRNDDGRPFMFIVGMFHTMAAQHVREARKESNNLMRYSAKGGVNARLKAIGIPVTAIDLAQTSGPVKVLKSKGFTEDFFLQVPEEREQKKRVWGLAYRGTVLGVQDMLASVGADFSAPDTVRAIQDADALKEALDRCAGKRELEGLVAAMRKSTLSVAQNMPKGNRRDMIEYMATTVGHPSQAPNVAKDNPSLCKPAIGSMGPGIRVAP